METRKPTHVVLVSCPGLGHLIPVIELAKRFVLHHNFKVTILAVTSQTSRAETQILNSALTSSLFHFIDIPSPDITALVAQNDTVFTRLCVVMREAKIAIRSILSEITPRPSALIVDIFSTEAIPIARELNIISYVFVASHAWMLALVIYSPVLDELVEGQYVDQKEPLKIPGCKPVQPEDVIEPMLDRNDRQYKEYLAIGNGFLQSDGVLVNTWEELQREELEALREGGLLSEALNMKIPVYAVGPLVRQPELETNSSSESLVKWLDEQPSQSVVYVSFGSGGTLSSEQMRELAWGLELSEQRFLWVVRAPIEKNADAAFFTTGSSGIDEVAKYLPEGFVSRTNEVGLLVPEWAQQVTILGHRAIGGFLTHCGWGSTLESVTNGVPLIAWPLYAEQRMNAALLAEELGVAVRHRVLPIKKVVRREEIAEMVKESVKSNRVRERMKLCRRVLVPLAAFPMAAITRLVKRTPYLPCAARRFLSHAPLHKERNVQWVFLGCPGVGKGTYASRLCNLLGVPHIATGDLVRSELASNGPLSSQLSEIVNQGKLVSDEIIMNLLSKRLADGEAKGESGFILDGFPRTMKQAEILEGVTDIDLVVNLKIQEEALLAKCLGRRICNECGGNFNVASISIKGENGRPSMVMDPLLPPAHCMSKLITRSDDTEAVVQERLRIYSEKSQPVEEFYRSRGKLLEFDLPGGIPESWPKLLQALDLYDYEEKQSVAA